MAKNPVFYYAVLAARIGGEDIRVHKIGPYKSQYDPKLVQKVERLFPPADWNVLLIKRLRDSDFGRTPGGWKQQHEYRSSKKLFDPTPGVIYETTSGSAFLCLCVNHKYSWAVMQSTESHFFKSDADPEKPWYWTTCVKNVQIYADGKITWANKTVTDGLPNPGAGYAERGSTWLPTEWVDLKSAIEGGRRWKEQTKPWRAS